MCWWCGDHTDSKIIPQPEGLDEWRDEGFILSVRWQRSIHHHQIKRLKTGIKEAKRGHQQRLERDLNTNSTLVRVPVYLLPSTHVKALRELKKANFRCLILVNFYRGAIEGILTQNSRWSNSPEHHWYHLQSISDISEVRCLHRAQRY